MEERLLDGMSRSVWGSNLWELSPVFLRAADSLLPGSPRETAMLRPFADQESQGEGLRVELCF